MIIFRFWCHVSDVFVLENFEQTFYNCSMNVYPIMGGLQVKVYSLFIIAYIKVTSIDFYSILILEHSLSDGKQRRNYQTLLVFANEQLYLLMNNLRYNFYSCITSL